MTSSNFQCQIIILFWRFHLKIYIIFQNILKDLYFPSQIFVLWKKQIENFDISENDIISVEVAKVLW
jgi:hypothetical protein